MPIVYTNVIIFPEIQRKLNLKNIYIIVQLCESTVTIINNTELKLAQMLHIIHLRIKVIYSSILSITIYKLCSYRITISSSDLN